MSKPVIVEYYTDLLCVWAWISQRRIEELEIKLGNKIEIRHHYLDVFGDTRTKMQKQWSDKGHYHGFSKHVVESASPYSDAIVNPDVWSKIQPTTSTNVHLLLKAIEITYDKIANVKMALAFRKAFFIDALDISHLDVLFEIIKDNELDPQRIKAAIYDGTAIASLMTDYQEAKQLSLKGSPSYIIDNGRQVLYGNVGYRVLFANIEEQLKHPEDEASWC